MNRRKVLLGCSAVLTGLMAGCGSTSSSDEPTPTETPTGTPTPKEISLGTPAPGENTPTETPEPTPTPTPTPEPTPTPTPTPAGEIHDVGEQFTVGSDSEAIIYRIEEFARAEELGSVMNPATADGTFLVVTLDLTNPRDERLGFPTRRFRARSPATWHTLNRDATDAIGPDDRIDVKPFTDRFVPSGETRTGAVAFDVDPENPYRLWILPTGDSDGEEHFVPIGDISSVEEL